MCLKKGHVSVFGFLCLLMYVFNSKHNSLLMCLQKLQDRMMKELHSQGKAIEDIVEVLKRIPIHPRVVPAIKSAHALGYELH